MRAGASERAGFIEAPLTGLDHRPRPARHPRHHDPTPDHRISIHDRRRPAQQRPNPTPELDVPLTDNGRTPVGLVTFNQIRHVPPQDQATTRLRDIACPLDQVAQARPDEPAADLLPRLSQCVEGRALVLSDGVLVGIISPSDINRALRWIGTTGPNEHR